MDVQLADFVTIGLLVVLEGLLSADNALVLAVMMLGLPRERAEKALRYGMVGASPSGPSPRCSRPYLIRVGWVKLLRRAYLFYLT